MSDSRQDYRHDSPPRRKDSPPRSSTLPSRAAVSRGTDSKRDRSPRLDDRRDRGHHDAHARRSSPRRSQNHRGRTPSPLPRPIRDNRGRELFEDKLKGPPKEAPSGRHREPRDLGERSRARDARPLSPRRPAQSPRRAADDYDASRTRHGGRSISPLSSASKRQRSRSPLPYPSSRSKRSKRDRERDHDRTRRRRGDRGDLLDDERDSSGRERPRSPYDTRSPSPRTRRGNPQSREDLFDSSRTRRYSRSPRGAHGRRPARSPPGESRRRSRDPVSRARLDSQERRPGSLRSLDGRDRNAGGPERSSSRSGANSMNFNPARQAADDRISQDRALDTSSGTKGHSPRKEGTVPSRGESPRPRSPYGSDTGGHDSRRQQSPQRTSNTDDPRSGDRDQRSRGDRTTPPPLSRGFTKSAFSGHQRSPRSESRHRQDESTAQPVRNVFRGDDESSRPPSHQLPSKPVSSTARNDGRSTPSIAEDKMDGVEQQGSSNGQGQPTASSPAASTSNSKFSFAFKATSKGPVTAPKLEISQKLSAPPKKDQPQPVADERSRDRDNGRGHGRGHDRDRERDRYREREGERERDWDRNGGRNRNRDHDRVRDQERERERERDRDRDRNREREHDLERLVDRPRDILRDAPKGPASSRPQLPAKPPPPQPEKPRIRMVKKIERKLKPKPQLPDELRTSWSIFFRKQGNESVIGSGTYGKVYKGVHVYTKKLVALKKIRMEGERDGFPVTAIREIKLLQSLKHKNIVDLQEVMVERHDCYMVFEYLSHDLTGLLNHPSYTLDPAQRKHLAMQLFEGLDYLHHRGVLHRDIKAANILVSSSGILKFADFGLARFYAKRHQYDYTNRVVTIWYRSPELLLGETQYGAPVDIWSAACVMVEIFTRHAIFPGDGSEVNQLDTIYAVLGTPNRQEWPNLPEMPWFELLRPSYRRPSAFVEKYQEKLPPAAFDLLSQMFQYDPAKRPSAAEVLQHAYFTTELPKARQAIELENIQGDWHELESKALRREKERQDREARKAAAATKDAAGGPGNANGAPASKDKERKRAPASHDAQRDPKRHHVQPHGDIGAIGTAEAVVAAALGN